jgi:cytochrome c2
VTRGGLRVAVALGFALSLLGAPPASAEDPERGRGVFADKRCEHCHQARGQGGIGPPLEALRRPQGTFELAGRLWNHAPAMFTVLTQEGIAWPEISPTEMADLMAYLRADPSGDREPDLYRGQLTLLSKGCLKCHRLRREGGRVGPELAERRPAYESAVAWAAAMWRHTPRMAAKALEAGIVYPRFAGAEMRDLVGFLQSAAHPR